jgi:hypothetical protein
MVLIRHSFLQMSAMTLGGVIEGDSRMRRYELEVRMRKRMKKAQGEERTRKDMYRQLRELEAEEQAWENNHNVKGG